VSLRLEQLGGEMRGGEQDQRDEDAQQHVGAEAARLAERRLAVAT